MNVLVLNGSPKGSNSITFQTVLYLQKMFPQHVYEVIHVGQQIRLLEKNMESITESLNNADIILFAYPVYTFIAPSQLHRFVELLKESKLNMKGKFATQITTSKHFYDVTAHRYIQDNCQDLGMKFIKGLSADMDDLLSEKGQKEAEKFWKYVTFCVKKDIYESNLNISKKTKPVKVTVPEEKKTDKLKDVVIVTDVKEDDTQLKSMIERFRRVLPLKTRIVNIGEYPFRGGCLGCFNCAVSGKCIYIDEFDSFLRNKIQNADAIIYAFTIRDHSMGATFKLYDDRQFCNGHRTVTMGMPMGYLVSGNYSAETNLQMILDARAEVGNNFLAGIACDEKNPDAEIDMLAKRLTYALKTRYLQPQNFYGVGGMKIFRDLIYLMQGMMKADHKFYKEHNQYDFPQKKKGTLIAMYLVGAMLSNPSIKQKAGSKMTEGMLMPYKKVLEKAEYTKSKCNNRKKRK